MIVAHSSTKPGYASSFDHACPVLALPAFSDNYLWLLHDTDGAAVVIDPGDATVVKAALNAKQLRLVAILLTHHHPDHIGGVAELAHRDLHIYGPHDSRVPATHRVGEADLLHPDWNGGSFKVMEVPGHTRSHLAYLHGDDLYCGDALFNLGCGRLFEGSAADAWNSLQKIAALAPSTQIYCAHEYTQDNLRFAQAMFPGDLALAVFAEKIHALRARAEPTVPFALHEQLELNPFLRMHSAHWRAQLGLPHLTHDAGAAFAEMRRRKDHFQ